MQGWAVLLRWGLLRKHNSTFPEQKERVSCSTAEQLSGRTRPWRGDFGGVVGVIPALLASAVCDPRVPGHPCEGTAGDTTGMAPAPRSPRRWWLANC